MPTALTGKQYRLADSNSTKSDTGKECTTQLGHFYFSYITVLHKHGQVHSSFTPQFNAIRFHWSLLNNVDAKNRSIAINTLHVQC